MGWLLCCWCRLFGLARIWVWFVAFALGLLGLLIVCFWCFGFCVVVVFVRSLFCCLDFVTLVNCFDLLLGCIAEHFGFIFDLPLVVLCVFVCVVVRSC